MTEYKDEDAGNNNYRFSIENQLFDFVDFICCKWFSREPNQENTQWKENDELQYGFDPFDETLLFWMVKLTKCLVEEHVNLCQIFSLKWPGMAIGRQIR